MKLYVNTLSPNARRVLLVAEHIKANLAVEVVSVDMQAGEHKKPWFLDINPNHKVPALADGDFKLWESNAIAQYLAAKASRTDLWPTDPAEQADVSRWQLYVHTQWNTAINPVVFERVLKELFGMGAPDEGIVTSKLAETREQFALVDAHLSKHPWLAAGRLTLADFALAASLMYAQPANLPISEYKNLSAWFGRIRELDAWKNTETKRS